MIATGRVSRRSPALIASGAERDTERF